MAHPAIQDFAGRAETRLARIFRQNAPDRARISGLVLQETPDSPNQTFAVTLSVKQV